MALNSTDFILIMLSDVHWVKILLFGIFLKIYLVALLANLLLISLRLTERRLRTPMYFFLSHLSCIDIILTSSITPKFLCDLLLQDASISFLGCAMQMYFSFAMGSSECLLLAIMSYDRYMAICKPLRYHVLMNDRICLLLAVSCWICGLGYSVLQTVLTFSHSFCKFRDVGHYFCEIQPLIRLSCDDTHVHELLLFSFSVIIGLCSFLLTLLSYIHIISTILTKHSSEGKSKVFSTCSSHLLVVTIFYGTIISIYVKPASSYTYERDRVVSVLYTMVIPMCNPLIYSIRNKEFKQIVMKHIGKNFHVMTCKAT